MKGSSSSSTTTTMPPSGSALASGSKPMTADTIRDSFDPLEGYEHNSSSARMRTRQYSSRNPRHEDGGRERESSRDRYEQLHAPRGPPANPEHFESDEEWQEHHRKEKVGPMHHLPLVLVALPPLGAIIHGRAENWTDGMILILVCFYLYHLVRVPWDLYYASRSRRILAVAIDNQEEDPAVVFMRKEAVHQLARSEFVSLLMTVITPIAGAYLLYFARNMLSDPDRYINPFTISLFALATAVKPLLHLAELFKRRALFYQEVVHYPSTQVHALNRKVDRLESELKTLNRAFATKDEVRSLREGVDIPLTRLSKAVRQYERKEENSRMTAEERFALLDAKLDEALRESTSNLELIEKLKQEYDEASSPLTTVLRVINHLLGHHPQGRRDQQKNVRWFARGPFYYLFLPVNISTLAVEWVATKATSANGISLEPRPARVSFADSS